MGVRLSSCTVFMIVMNHVDASWPCHAAWSPILIAQDKSGFDWCPPTVCILLRKADCLHLLRASKAVRADGMKVLRKCIPNIQFLHVIFYPHARRNAGEKQRGGKTSHNNIYCIQLHINIYVLLLHCTCKKRNKKRSEAHVLEQMNQSQLVNDGFCTRQLSFSLHVATSSLQMKSFAL